MEKTQVETLLEEREDWEKAPAGGKYCTLEYLKADAYELWR